MQAIWGLLFIGLVVLIPLAMTVLLVVLVFRRRAIARQWRDDGDRIGMRIIECGTTEHDELVHRLKSTLFDLDAHDEHRVTHALTGTVEGHPTWVAYTVSTGDAPAKRRAAATGLATCVETAGFPHGLVLARPPQSGVASRLISLLAPRAEPEEEEWSWVRTNSLSLFDELDASEADSVRLKALLEPGDTLLTFRDLVIHMRPLDNSLDARRIGACLATTADRVGSLLRLTRDRD